MSWMTNFINWVNGFVGNFGWTVVILVIASQILLIPCKIFAGKNRKAKQACEPEIRRIRKKYNANQMGVSMDDPPDLDPAVRKMSHDERDEAMANEIEAVYKAHGYHLWTSWIPTVINLAFILLLWSGIGEATPDGFFSYTIKDIGANANMWNVVLLFATPVLTLLSGCVTLIGNIVKNKKANIPLKPIIIAGLISLVISMAFSIWIATSISTALALALAIMQAWSTIAGWISKLTGKEPAEEL
ncbi:MAG: YidC/Oxa1 family membrane protein insertase [Bacteroidaceae bacterium]|nr:YidC/Oxa1 family membrane protein insertase [Bacteroidaceae bacterium]